MNLRNKNLRFLLFLYYCAFSSCFCDKWLMTQFVIFFDTQWLEVLEPTYFYFSCIKAILKQYLRCLPKCFFHSVTISTIFKDYNSLLMLQSSLFNVNITKKIPNLFAFMKSACRFGHSKEKNGSSCIFTSSGILPIPKIFIKVIRGLKAQFSEFRLSGGIIVYWKSKLSSNLTRNKSLELVLEHTLRLSVTYFWTFWSLRVLLFTKSHRS